MIAGRKALDPTKGQRNALLLCWMAYTLAYSLRVNIAVVIPALAADRGYSYTGIGLITSLFFITYTIGQLVNGFLGDRVSGKTLIVAGLAFSALFNIGFASLPGFASAAVCWALNGFAQSMLWAPIMKTLSVWFSGPQLERVSYVMSWSMIVGYALSWGTSSLLYTRYDWRFAFLLPAVIVLVQAVLLVFFLKTRPGVEYPEQVMDTAAPSIPDVRVFFKMIRIPGLLLIAMSQGVIREGIGVWFPTILQDTVNMTRTSPWMIYILLPVLNLCGVAFVRRVHFQYRGDSTRTLLWFFTLISVVAALLAILTMRWPSLILAGMVVLLPLSYGLTPILTSVIPFQFAHHRRVALTAGVLDFSIYLGAAVSGLVSGIIADRYSWDDAILLWLAAAVVGLAVSAVRLKRNREARSFEQAIHPADGAKNRVSGENPPF